MMVIAKKKHLESMQLLPGSKPFPIFTIFLPHFFLCRRGIFDFRRLCLRVSSEILRGISPKKLNEPEIKIEATQLKSFRKMSAGRGFHGFQKTWTKSGGTQSGKLGLLVLEGFGNFDFLKTFMVQRSVCFRPMNTWPASPDGFRSL